MPTPIQISGLSYLDVPYAAGYPYTSVPGVGPVSTWGGSPGSLAFNNTALRLVDWRRNTIPLIRNNTRYVGQSVSGNSTGGGGLGTLESPWLVRHRADLRTLYNANAAANTAWLFRCGDTFYATDSNTDQGIVGSHTNITFASYSDPTQPSITKPRLVMFKAAYGALNWDAAGGDMYSRTEPTTVYWVRCRVGGGSYESFRTKPYVRYANSSDALANEGGWFWGGGVLYIHLYIDHSISDVEAIVATGHNFNLLNFQSMRISDLTLEGGGFGSGDIGGQNIRVEPTGTNEHYISNIDAYWSTYHNLASLTTSGTGGIATYDSCQAGLMVNTTSSCDAFLGFCSAGGNEYLRYNCSANIGPLQSLSGTDFRTLYGGTPCYGHTSAGTVSMFLEVNNNDTSTNAYTRCGSFPSSGDCPIPSSRTDWTQYRSFFINGTGLFSGAGASDSKYPWYAGCVFKIDAITTGFNTFIITGSAAFNYMMSNCDINIEINGNWTNKYFYMFIPQTTPLNCDWFNTRLYITQGPGSTMGNNDFIQMSGVGTDATTMGLYNCVISNGTGKLQSTLSIGNANPFSPGPGGSSKTAFFGWPAAQYASALSPIVPALVPNYTTRAGINAELIAASGALPSGITINIDDTNSGRPPAPFTLGPLEKNIV